MLMPCAGTTLLFYDYCYGTNQQRAAAVASRVAKCYHDLQLRAHTSYNFLDPTYYHSYHHYFLHLHTQRVT